MGTGRAYVAALAGLTAIDDPDERRRTWRQGMAALAAAVHDRGAPLEGLDPQALLDGARVAMADGLFADTSFLAPAAAATALFGLAGGLPPGVERRELGRRVLEQLDQGDADTFVALATAVAIESPRALAGGARRARVAAALSAPLAAGTGADALAMALVARPDLERAWLDEPSTGSLPSRRLAARVLERAAREAVRRHRRGDDGGLVVLARPGIREVWGRLLTDREALVWRHAAVARGLLAGQDRAFADELARELAAAATPSEWRRGAASLAAAIEVDGAAAARCRAFLDGELPGRDPGVVRGLLAGLPGAFAVEPDLADELALHAIRRAGLDAVEAVVELRRELGTVGPRAAEAAAAWLRRAHDDSRVGRADDGRTALLAALATELTGDAEAIGGSLAAHAAAARAALRAGRLADATRAAHAAASAVAEAFEFLERYDDGDAVERRHAFRTLRELDQELLSDGAVIGLLARSRDVHRGRSDADLLGDLQARLEAALLARERTAEAGPVAHATLRLARLRVLVRAVDADAPTDDPTALRERRFAVVRALLPRARLDASPLRRAVWAALTRAFDALLRDDAVELSDLVAGWASAMDPDEDFAIAREASMVPAVRATLDAYARAMAAAAAAADPDDRAAAITAVRAAGGLVGALGAVSSPRTEALRTSLGGLVRGLDAIVRAAGQRAVPAVAFEQLEASAAVLADLVVGARRRLGLGVAPATSPPALHALAVAAERVRRGGQADVGAEAGVAAVAAADDQLPVVARLVGVALARLARLPVDAPPRELTADLDGPDVPGVPGPIDDVETELPRWLPASRGLGGFYVVRPLGKGAGGSVFVACRMDERHEPAPELVALKVPDYDGGAARSLSVDEFEAMFREEAGALLALPRHPNLARFVTFDAGARPKPILVMEYVEGQTLEQLLDVGGLDTRGALALIDGIAAGLEQMHAARVAHLDLKPANVILRGDATPVLVDFGLAGRRLRPGCGSPHYGAPEVWSARTTVSEPYAADVYALACLAFEVLTQEVLVAGDALSDVLTTHLGGGAEARVRARLGRDPRTALLADLLGAALNRRADQRPTMVRLRAGLAAVAPDLARVPWPLAVG